MFNTPSQNVNCNLCGSAENEIISRKGQFNIPLQVVICRQCGLVYLSPRWSKDEYMSFYADEYDRYYRKHIYSHTSGAQQSSNIIITRLKEKGFLPESPVNILDIGSGEGENLNDLEQQFPAARLWAIEPSLQSQKILKEKGYSILGNDAEANWQQNCSVKFDLIIMRHVLEHFMDPRALLGKVCEVLSPGGVLYIAVPNAYKPRAPLQSYWFRVVHTYYFNKDVLAVMLNKAGLQAHVVMEGDSANPFELIVMAGSNTSVATTTTLPKVYERQKEVLHRMLKKENGFLYKAIRKPVSKMKKIVAKIIRR